MLEKVERSDSISHRRAEIGGTPLAELNALELDFLFAIDFDLGVHPADFAACTADLRVFAAARRIPDPAAPSRQAPSSHERPPVKAAAARAPSTPTASLDALAAPERRSARRDANLLAAANLLERHHIARTVSLESDSLSDARPTKSQSAAAAAAAAAALAEAVAPARMADLAGTQGELRIGSGCAGVAGVPPPPSGPALPAASGAGPGGH